MERIIIAILIAVIMSCAASIVILAIKYRKNTKYWHDAYDSRMSQILSDEKTIKKLTEEVKRLKSYPYIKEVYSEYPITLRLNRVHSLSYLRQLPNDGMDYLKDEMCNEFAVKLKDYITYRVSKDFITDTYILEAFLRIIPPKSNKSSENGVLDNIGAYL